MRAALADRHDVVGLQPPVLPPALLAPPAGPPHRGLAVPEVLRRAVDLGVPLPVSCRLLPRHESRIAGDDGDCGDCLLARARVTAGGWALVSSG